LGTIGGGSQLYQPYILNSKYKIVEELTNADYITNNSLYIGNHPEIKEEEIINICKKLNKV
jgi:dTDP-4-amino-4,6-dideoxygalactose transaminase